MIRFAFACAGLVAATTGVAHAADSGTPLPNGAMLTWPRLLVSENDELKEPADSTDLRNRLNLAHCVCSQSDTTIDTQLYYELQLSANTLTGRPGDVWVGTQCDDNITRPMNCRQISGATIPDIDVLQQRAENIIVRPYDMINATTTLSTQACRQDVGDAFVWIIVDADGDNQPDFFSSRIIDLEKFSDVHGFDTQPPPLPENLKASGGEGSIDVTWTIPASRATDLYAFQAFCIDTATGGPIGNGGGALYQTSDSVCGIPQQFDLTATDITDSTDGSPVAALPAEFASLDPAFLCGTQPSGTATSLEIKGLENNKEYTIALVAVDFYGNATGAYFTKTVVPKPVTDLWEDIHDRGGKIEGGLFCSSSGSPDGLAGIFVILALPWLWRRRRRLFGKRTVMVVSGLAIVMLSHAARADDFTPYWEDHDEQGGFADAEENVRWHAGIKLGPWTPDMDTQLGKNPKSGMGPYQAMFGNYFLDGKGHDEHVYQLMPMLDVDRVIWKRSGQLAIGGTLGYMQKTAYAYLDGTTADDPRRERSSSSQNTFRLIPFAATVTYRATQLDDLYGIPLVPYVRGGLSYYVWWLKGPSGDLSKVCKDGSMTMGCDTNTAYGGTLGFQGTVGLALRLERIDSDAARSMVQSGIYHAGFYGELTYAKVDGFGSDKKLSVGDSTWFTGVDFEF